MSHHQDQDHDEPNFLLCNDEEFKKYRRKLLRYRIDAFSDLKQNVSKHKADRIQSLFKKTKKKIAKKTKTPYNQGRWTKLEEDLYLKFVRQAQSSQSWGQKETYKKRKNYFTEMSKFIKTRNPLQCRSHDQKMVLKNSHSDPNSSEDCSEISQLELSESEPEEILSEAKIEVKAESESHHTRETQREISSQSTHTPRFNFDLPGLTKPDPCFNLVCRENLGALKPTFPSPSFARNLQAFNKENELEKKTMQVEEEGAQGKDMEKIREDYFGMMRRMMRRRMLDVLSSCPMIEE